MKWPWVARSALDVLATAHDDTLAELRQLRQNIGDVYRTKDARIAALTDELLRMKRAGYEPTPKDPEPDPDLVLPTPVEAAIEERAIDTDTRRRLTRFALVELRKHDATPEQVAALILDGDDIDELTL